VAVSGTLIAAAELLTDVLAPYVFLPSVR